MSRRARHVPGPLRVTMKSAHGDEGAAVGGSREVPSLRDTVVMAR